MSDDIIIPSFDKQLEKAGIRTIRQDSADELKSLLHSKPKTFLVFYAPWCGHCQRLLPELVLMNERLGSDCQIVAVDATKNKKLSSLFNVLGYPTIYKINGSDYSKRSQFSGQRTVEEMKKFLER